MIDTSILRENETERSRNFVLSYLAFRGRLEALALGGANLLVSLIADLRGEMQEQLDMYDPDDPSSPYSARIVPVLASELSVALQRSRAAAGLGLERFIQDAFDLGELATPTAMRAAGLNIGIPSISSTTIDAMVALANTTVSTLFSRVGDAIMTEIRRSAAGIISSGELQRRLERILQTSPEIRDGMRKRIGFAFQAEAIARTEVNSVYSLANQLSNEAISDQIPGLRKKWLTAGFRERKGHKEVEKETEKNPILVSEKFTVKDYSRTGKTRFLTVGGTAGPGYPGGYVIKTKKPYQRRGKVIVDKMMHPHDPTASVGNRANCRCTVLSVVPDMDEALNRLLGIIEQG